MNSNYNQYAVGGNGNMAMHHALQLQYEAIRYDNRERMAQAIAILNNHPRLMKIAVANGQSVPKTRLYFEKVAAGANPQPTIRNWMTGPIYSTNFNSSFPTTNVSGYHSGGGNQGITGNQLFPTTHLSGGNHLFPTSHVSGGNQAHSNNQGLVNNQTLGSNQALGSNETGEEHAEN